MAWGWTRSCPWAPGTHTLLWSAGVNPHEKIRATDTKRGKKDPNLYEKTSILFEVAGSRGKKKGHPPGGGRWEVYGEVMRGGD